MKMSARELNFKPLQPSDAATCGNKSMVGFVRNCTKKVTFELAKVDLMTDSLSKISEPAADMSKSLTAVADSLGGIRISITAVKNNMTALKRACAALPAMSSVSSNLPDNSVFDNLVGPLQSGRTMMLGAKGQMSGLFHNETGMVGKMSKMLQGALGPANEMLSTQVSQVEMMLLGVQDQLLSSRITLTSTQQAYNQLAFTRIPHVLGGLALVPFFVNLLSIVALLCGCRIFSKCSACLTFLFLFWFCLIGGLFRVIHAVTYDVCAEHEQLLSFYTEEYEFQLPNSNATLALAPHWRELLYCGTGVMINGTNGTAPHTVPDNLIDIYNLRDAMDLNSIIMPMVTQLAEGAGQLNAGMITNMTDQMLSGMDGFSSANMSAYTNSLKEMQAEIDAQGADVPKLGVNGQLDFTDPATRTKMDSKMGEGKTVSSVEELLVSINKITKAVQPQEYTLNTMRTLNTAALATPPLNGVTGPTQKQLLATEVGMLEPFNAKVVEVEDKLQKIAAISKALASTMGALDKVGNMESGLGGARTTVEKDVGSLKSAMGNIGGDVGKVVAGFKTIEPAIKASIGDYATCGWVAKNYASMKIAVCRDTVNGLHDIGLYLFAGAVLFFLSYFLHLHIAAFLAAYSEHGYEMVELTEEFGKVIKQ
jgi:hypothetical protein